VKSSRLPLFPHLWRYAHLLSPLVHISSNRTLCKTRRVLYVSECCSKHASGVSAPRAEPGPGVNAQRRPGTLGAKRHALREEFRTESLTGHTKDWAEVERSGTTNTPIRGFVRFREEGRGARLAAIWGKYPGFKK